MVGPSFAGFDDHGIDHAFDERTGVKAAGKACIFPFCSGVIALEQVANQLRPYRSVAALLRGNRLLTRRAGRRA